MTVPFGTWPSPLSAEAVAAGAMQMEVVALEQGSIYWLERRPWEGGRTVVVCHAADGTQADVTPDGTNVRSRVHEYGGGSCCVDEGTVYYANFADQRLYMRRPGSEPVALTPPGPWRFADMIVDRRRKRIICVREDHSGLAPSDSAPGREPVNTLVSIAVDGTPGAGVVIAAGYDFYASPRLSPDGTRLAWLCWRHPQMPWDGTELYVAGLDIDGRPVSPERVAGSEEEAVVHPGWSTDGVLYFVSDRSGWWNLYRWQSGEPDALLPLNAEFGRPAWEFGQTTWAFAVGTAMAVSFCRHGRWRLAVFDVETGLLNELEWAPEPGNVVLASDKRAVYVGRSPTSPDVLVRVDLESGRAEPIRAASAPVLDRRFVSVPQPLVFPTSDGETARLFHYPPVNPDVEQPMDEKPPLIVISHGGPTSAATTRLALSIQFWTTRGFAVADVDYRGSTGYGRAYRERLYGQWGILDVDDCVDAARFLVARGLADEDRLIIRGASAGGFTTLAALTFRPGVFKAGACYYGIGDLEALARDTHKFESRYTDRLIAPYPERVDLYRARSPIHAVDRLSCPVIFFHGREDLAVPVAQAETMAEAIRRKGVRADLHVFEGEQHGFRRRETIVHCLEAELAFYSDVFGLTREGPSGSTHP